MFDSDHPILLMIAHQWIERFLEKMRYLYQMTFELRLALFEFFDYKYGSKSDFQAF